MPLKNIKKKRKKRGISTPPQVRHFLKRWQRALKHENKRLSEQNVTRSWCFTDSLKWNSQQMSNSSLAFETLRSKCRLVQHLLTSFKHALYTLWANFFRSHLLGCHATDRIAVWHPNKLLQSQFVSVCLWLVVMETTHDLIIRVSGKGTRLVFDSDSSCEEILSQFMPIFSVEPNQSLIQFLFHSRTSNSNLPSISESH